MKYTYLILNILIVIFPLLFSFEKKLRFYKKIPFVIGAGFIVNIPFILWDISFTKNKVWGFNPEYVTGIYLFGLPLEEILFFITVPYSMIYLFETFRYYIKLKEINFNKLSYFFISIFAFTISIIFNKNDYTFYVFIAVGVLFTIMGLFKLKILNDLRFWIYMLLAFIPFFSINFFLTYLPVVKYNPEQFSNIRIISIPLEDFFYNFTLISSYIIVYEQIKTMRNRYGS